MCYSALSSPISSLSLQPPPGLILWNTRSCRWRYIKSIRISCRPWLQYHRSPQRGTLELLARSRRCLWPSESTPTRQSVSTEPAWRAGTWCWGFSKVNESCTWILFQSSPEWLLHPKQFTCQQTDKYCQTVYCAKISSFFQVTLHYVLVRV